MILTDREIKLSLEGGLIHIDPPPRPEAFTPTTVDLTLDPILRVFKNQPKGLNVAIDPGKPDYKATELIEQLTEQVTIGPNGFDVDSNVLVLGWTREFVALKKHARVAGRVEGKSGLARIGLAVHVTAPNYSRRLRGSYPVRDCKPRPDSYQAPT